jgi:hypothetical protein
LQAVLKSAQQMAQDSGLSDVLASVALAEKSTSKA